jgi:anti-sigma28 factor (negative regulator of flagellin synthesis)
VDSHNGAAVDSPIDDSQAGSAEMAVNGPGPVQNPNPVKTTFTTPPVQKTAETRPAIPRDEVEISTAGKMLDSLNQSGDVRAERLANIKTAIDAGKYETPEKLEAALLKMLQEIDTPDVPPN